MLISYIYYYCWLESAPPLHCLGQRCFAFGGIFVSILNLYICRENVEHLFFRSHDSVQCNLVPGSNFVVMK